jgi:PPM family protein phosphatase
MNPGTLPTLNAWPSWEIGKATHVGRKHQGEPNQDAMLVLPAEANHPPLYLVADGMGGHAGGAEASRIVVESVADYYRSVQFPADPALVLKDSLLHAHQALTDHVKDHPTLYTMGSTAVAAIIDGGEVFVANVGDSRAYLLHDQTMTQLSYDHSIVGEMVRAGKMTPVEALQSKLRNRLTQSLSPMRQDITPHLSRAAFGNGDTLVLCTDGLWGVVTEAILQAVALELSPQIAAEKLIQLTLARGAPDNVTVVISRKRLSRIAPAAGVEDNRPGE